MHIPYSARLTRRILSIIIICSGLLSACNSETTPTENTPEASTHPDVLASFIVEIPTPIPAGTQLSLEMVDPLNVHELNPVYQVMQPIDDLHYQVDIPAKKGSLLQYRFVNTGKTNEVELGLDGQPLPSRFFYITNHSRIQDAILGFSAPQSKIITGSIEGTLIVHETGQPAVGMLITTSGIATTSSIDGSFRLEGIPVGTQNVTIFSPDGSLEAFEQQAVIEENNVTPIDVELTSKKLINVTFIVKAPQNTPVEAELRLFGNLASLGDSFAGLFGGTNLVQNRAPVLSRQAENEYLIVLQLPADTEVHYLYSLGDTFWNRENISSGLSTNRTLFVPGQDTVIEDQIESWKTPKLEPIIFQFTPPADTLATDHIQIQFNAYGWMDPLEMWPVGNGSFEFQLFNPLNFSSPVNYRFCRSLICGTTDPESKEEKTASFQSSSTAQTLQSAGGQWVNWVTAVDPTVVATESIQPKPGGFHTAIEISDSYRPAWLPYYSPAMDAIAGLNANTIILPITWTFQSANPVWLDLDLSQNPSIEDIRKITAEAKAKGFQVYLIAMTQYPTSSTDFWNAFSKDTTGWEQWFDAMAKFYLFSARLAQVSQADGLILGDESTSA
ncbi:MAG TPA: hypothetical protein VF338_02110, partial [Leptolinea sp.]